MYTRYNLPSGSVVIMIESTNSSRVAVKMYEVLGNKEEIEREKLLCETVLSPKVAFCGPASLHDIYYIN